MTHGRFNMIAAAACLICAAVARAAAAPVIVDPIVESQRVVLKGHVHRALRESEDLGAAAASQRAERIVLLMRGSPSQEADLQSFLRDIQTPGRPDYHRWLTPGSFEQRFGVASSDLSTVRKWLESKGLQIDEQPRGGRSLIFSGTVGSVNQAFATQIRRYRWRGENHVANANNPSIPKALSGVIAGIASLDDFYAHSQWLPSGLVPQLTAANGTHFLAPGDFATIYDLNSAHSRGVNGNARSIAVIGRSQIALTDVSTFRSNFGLPASAPQIIVNGADPGFVADDETESDLDIEWAGAVAPSAAILFVVSKSTSMSDGIALSSQYAVSNNVADIITVSYGACESTEDVSGGTTLYNSLWQQAAAQGISVFVASGDSGAAGCDPANASKATHGLGVNQVCSSPYSTCVGGTEFIADNAVPATYWSANNAPTTQSSALSYIGEAVWNQSGAALYASGGGGSIYFAKPAWQLSPGVPSDGQRDVPDVALTAASNHDPYLMYTSDGYSSSTLIAIGGTSASTPSMAGIAALVAQNQGGRVGAFNPVLYGLSALQAKGGAAIFHLQTSGNNSVPGQSGFSASVGDPTYNQAAGLGSLDGAQLLAHWNDYVPSSAGLSPAYVVVPATAGLGSATLTLPAGMTWSTTVEADALSWLSISPSSGGGSAPLTYAVAANPNTTARTGMISAAGQLLSITQASASAGSGDAASLSVSSASLGFGADGVGNPTSQRILVSNTGNASLTLGTIDLSGSTPQDYSSSGSCVAGLTLIAGSSCYLDVAFDPTRVGTRAATLQVAVSGGGSTNIALSGTGTNTGEGGSDGPLPIWAYVALMCLLMLIAVRRPPVAMHR